MTTSRTRPLAISLFTLAIALGFDAGAHAQDRPFPVARLFFELNDTAGDLGIHGEVDGGPWVSLQIEGPGDRKLLNLVSHGRLRGQALTQLAFESAEPTFDELAPAQFFRRFPEGHYDIEGRTPDGGELESEVWLSHILASRPPNIRVNGIPAAESCDAEDLPEVQSPVTIDWDPVTRSHPTLGRRGRVTIARYQFFLERPDGQLAVDLPPTTTAYEVPFTPAEVGGTFKFEIIARTKTGNNTAVESCFRLR